MTETTLAFSNATISDDASSLQNIHSKSKNIAIYQRDIAQINAELDQVAEQTIECRASGTVQEITNALNIYFTDELPAHQALLKDILSLLGHFKEITKTSTFRILLATVNTNMCRKFHTDINDLRMLCTYVGPGTLWIPDEAIKGLAAQKDKIAHFLFHRFPTIRNTTKLFKNFSFLEYINYVF